MKEYKRLEVSSSTQMRHPRKSPPGNRFRTSKLKDGYIARSNQSQSSRLTKECKPIEAMDNHKTHILQRAETRHERTTKGYQPPDDERKSRKPAIPYIRQGETCDNQFQTLSVRDLCNSENSIEKLPELMQECKLTPAMNIPKRPIHEELESGKAVRKRNRQDLRT
jgi:hypothetical protein